MAAGLASSPSLRNGARIPPGHILVSEKFHASDIIKTLQENHVNVVVDNSVGMTDFHPSSEVGVLYLSEADVVGTSGASYRNKVMKFSRANFRCIIMAEKTPLSSQYYQELQKFIVIERGIALLPVGSTVEAGRILAQMVKLEAKPHNNPYCIKMKALPVDQALLTTVQSIPGLGKKKALALLNKFHSIDEISRASIAALASIIGNSSAANVQDFFQQQLQSRTSFP